MSGEAGQIDPELLFFEISLSLYDIYIIRKDDIRDIVVDDRLAQGLPLYGTYIAAGEPARRLTLAELNKFNTYPFIKRIYDNGPIQVYDTTRLLVPSARRRRRAPLREGPVLTWASAPWPRAGCGVVAAQTAPPSGAGHDVEHLVVCGVVGALVIGVFGAFLVRLTRVLPETVAIIVLSRSLR